MAGPEFIVRVATIAELSAVDMLDILELRSRVFVVEQNCVYQDPGPEDRHPATLHLMLHNIEGKLAAYARLLAPGVDGNEPAIGRVVNDPDQRGKGLGKLLMGHSMQQVESHWPGQPMRLHAQTYLEKFYRGFEFQPVGEVYLLDGIDHVEMVRTAAP
ncbi:MAG: GNAT family N-acetyltransferase [Planctomycetota bacterium]|nr:GNAT family N-acetyltransferase [Planctomycetota bacterium]